jgi:hypothetical protein
MEAPSQNTTGKQWPAIFISYKREAYPDEKLAEAIYDGLKDQIGTSVFLDRQTIQPGDEWEWTIGEYIRKCDYFVVVLSKVSLRSDYVRKEMRIAVEQAGSANSTGPRLIPVTIELKGPLPEGFAEIDKHNRIEWDSAADTADVVEKLKQFINEDFLSNKREQTTERELLEDGDEYYIARECDAEFYNHLARPGVTVTLVGPMQTGKTLLLERGKQKAREAGQYVIDIDLQFLEPEAAKGDRSRFYEQFARTLREKVLELNVPALVPIKPEIADAAGSPPDACTGWLEKNVLQTLRQRGTRMLLTLDNLDAILLTPMAKDFVSMLRSWHNLRFRNQWKALGLVMVAYNRIFTYLQTSTPFNVGEEIVLGDFTQDHLSVLNEAYTRPADPDALTQMENLLSGHPYLTQLVFRRLAALRAENPMAAIVKCACTEEGPFGRHLSVLRKHVFDEALDSDLRRVLTEALCGEIAFYKLQRHGLVRREHKAVKPRCRLYAEYFERVLEER